MSSADDSCDAMYGWEYIQRVIHTAHAFFHLFIIWHWLILSISFNITLLSLEYLHDSHSNSEAMLVDMGK